MQADGVDAALCEMVETFQALAGLRTPHLINLDLTMPQLKVLFLLWEEEGITSRALASRLGVGAPAVSSLVDRLVGQGHVSREVDPVDRRVARWRLTPAGRTLLESMVIQNRERVTRVLRRLTPGEVALVARVFSLLRVAIQQVHAESGVPSRMD